MSYIFCSKSRVELVSILSTLSSKLEIMNLSNF